MCLMRSTAPKRGGWAWGWPFVAPSWRPTTARLPWTKTPIWAAPGLRWNCPLAPSQAPVPENAPMTHAAIHIVDDDADVREGLAWLFDSRGHATAVWDSGAPFLEAARALHGQWQQAVVLLDVRMAPLSGLQVFEQLKAMACPWPVLVFDRQWRCGYGRRRREKWGLGFSGKVIPGQRAGGPGGASPGRRRGRR